MNAECVVERGEDGGHRIFCTRKKSPPSSLGVRMNVWGWKEAVANGGLLGRLPMGMVAVTVIESQDRRKLSAPKVVSDANHKC